MANIRTRIRGGESAVLEYKSTCPEPFRLARVLCAFANGHGGDVAVGVDNLGTPCGLEDPEADRARIEEAVALLDPEPEITIESARQDLKDLILVRVEPLEFPDFCRVRSPKTREGTVYVRVRSETRPVDSDIIKDAQRLRKRYAHVTLDDEGRRLVAALWERGELKEPVCANLFNWSSRRLRKLAETLVGAGYLLQCRQPQGRTYIALVPPDGL